MTSRSGISSRYVQIGLPQLPERAAGYERYLRR